MRYLWEQYRQGNESWQSWIASVCAQQLQMAGQPVTKGNYESWHSVSNRAWQSFSPGQEGPWDYWEFVELSIDNLRRAGQPAAAHGGGPPPPAKAAPAPAPTPAKQPPQPAKAGQAEPAKAGPAPVAKAPAQATPETAPKATFCAEAAAPAKAGEPTARLESPLPRLENPLLPLPRLESPLLPLPKLEKPQDSPPLRLEQHHHSQLLQKLHSQLTWLAMEKVQEKKHLPRNQEAAVSVDVCNR